MKRMLRVPALVVLAAGAVPASAAGPLGAAMPCGPGVALGFYPEMRHLEAGLYLAAEIERIWEEQLESPVNSHAGLLQNRAGIFHLAKPGRQDEEDGFPTQRGGEGAAQGKGPIEQPYGARDFLRIGDVAPRRAGTSHRPRRFPWKPHLFSPARRPRDERRAP